MQILFITYVGAHTHPASQNSLPLYATHEMFKERHDPFPLSKESQISLAWPQRKTNVILSTCLCAPLHYIQTTSNCLQSTTTWRRIPTWKIAPKTVLISSKHTTVCVPGSSTPPAWNTNTWTYSSPVGLKDMETLRRNTTRRA